MQKSAYCLTYTGGSPRLLPIQVPFSVLFSADGNKKARVIAGETCTRLSQRVEGKIRVLSLKCGTLKSNGTEKLGHVLTQEEALQTFKPKRAISFDLRHYALAA